VSKSKESQLKKLELVAAAAVGGTRKKVKKLGLVCWLALACWTGHSLYWAFLNLAQCIENCYSVVNNIISMAL